MQLFLTRRSISLHRFALLALTGLVSLLGARVVAQEGKGSSENLAQVGSQILRWRLLNVELEMPAERSRLLTGSLFSIDAGAGAPIDDSHLPHLFLLDLAAGGSDAAVFASDLDDSPSRLGGTIAAPRKRSLFDDEVLLNSIWFDEEIQLDYGPQRYSSLVQVEAWRNNRAPDTTPYWRTVQAELDLLGKQQSSLASWEASWIRGPILGNLAGIQWHQNYGTEGLNFLRWQTTQSQLFRSWGQPWNGGHIGTELGRVSWNYGGSLDDFHWRQQQAMDRIVNQRWNQLSRIEELRIEGMYLLKGHQLKMEQIRAMTQKWRFDSIMDTTPQDLARTASFDVFEIPSTLTQPVDLFYTVLDSWDLAMSYRQMYSLALRPVRVPHSFTIPYYGPR